MRAGKKGEAEGHKGDERDERSGRMNIRMAEEGIKSDRGENGRARGK
jgi:hypothetical protein